MLIQNQIETKISDDFSVIKLILENESHMHGGSNPESHFKMTLVSNDFKDLTKVKRHQQVYKSLTEVMPKFHALALFTFSDEEWQVFAGNTDSPNCLGGGL